MNLHKQDDHIFNKALQKASAELLKIVQEELDADALFQRTDGAAERVRPLKEALKRLHDGFGQPAFALTVRKGNDAAVADTNSHLHGKAKEQMVLAFRQFLTSLKWFEIHSAAPASPARNATLDFHERALRTSNQLLRIEFGRWLSTGFDDEAARLLRAQDPATAKPIQDGQDHLHAVHVSLAEFLRRYMPD